MTTNTKKAIILSISVFILSLILFCVKYLPDNSNTEDLKTDKQSLNIINEHIENINNINIINDYGEYNFVKGTNDSSNLVIEELINYKKNQNAFDELSDKVCNFVADKIVNISETDQELYGFNIPRAKINIKYNNNLEIKLLIGNAAPGNIGYYVTKQDSSQVYLVSDNVISVFLKSKLDYISLDIISQKSDDEAMKDLEYVELTNNNQDEKIKIIKTKSKNKYNIIEPIQKKVSEVGSKTIESFENIFAQKIEAINLTSEDIENFGFNNPVASLNLKYKDQEVINILISEIPESEDFFVFRKDYNIIYRVSKSNLDWVYIKTDDLI
ncbi:MAG: DUF4340 domain-containing protein [Oscillospiraceae bacterium]|nr:DUF4340 domain-containing protein [Oscillospiraceae bacterium]